MALTDQQRRLAESAMPIVPKALAAFWRRYPTLRRRLARIDAENVAHLAICRAAVTYDPAQSQVTTYFSMAIRNAVLKELDRDKRLRYDSHERVPIELAEALALSPKAVTTKLQVAITRLPAKSRRLIVARFYKGLSLREIGEQAGCDPRTIKRRLAASLYVLQRLLETDGWLP